MFGAVEGLLPINEGDRKIAPAFFEAALGSVNTVFDGGLLAIPLIDTGKSGTGGAASSVRMAEKPLSELQCPSEESPSCENVRDRDRLRRPSAVEQSIVSEQSYQACIESGHILVGSDLSLERLSLRGDRCWL